MAKASKTKSFEKAPTAGRKAPHELNERELSHATGGSKKLGQTPILHGGD